MIVRVEEKLVLVLSPSTSQKPANEQHPRGNVRAGALLAGTGSAARRHRADGRPGQCLAQLVVHLVVGDLKRHVAASFVPGHRGLHEVSLRSSLLLFEKKVFPFFLVW